MGDLAYQAEFMLQNPGACFTEVVDQDGGERCVRELSASESPDLIPPDVQPLPASTNGNDTNLLQNFVNNAPVGGKYIGNGNYRHDKITIPQSIEIHMLNSTPFTNNLGSELFDVRGPDVLFNQCEIDCFSAFGLEWGWWVKSGADRFRLYKSYMHDLCNTQNENSGCIWYNAVDDIEIIGNRFERIWSFAPGSTGGNAWVVWNTALNGTFGGGKIHANRILDVQGESNDNGGGWFKRQSVPDGNITSPVQLFANRCIDVNKRFYKFQSGQALALSNYGEWANETGAVCQHSGQSLGNRSQLALCSVIQDGSGVSNNVIYRNNRHYVRTPVDDYDYLLVMGGNFGGTMSDVHMDNNYIYLESDTNNNGKASAGIFAHTGNSGSLGQYQNCSANNNCFDGPGTLGHCYHLADMGFSNLPPAGNGNFDITGNQFLAGLRANSSGKFF